MRRRSAKILGFLLVYLLLALGRAVTEEPVDAWRAYPNWSLAGKHLLDNFWKSANQVMSGATSAAVIAVITWFSTHDNRQAPEKADAALPSKLRQDVRGVHYRGAFFPEKEVLRTIDVLKTRLRNLGTTEEQLETHNEQLRMQAEGMLIRLGRLEMFRWTYLCLVLTALSGPVSVVCERILRSWIADPSSFIWQFGQSVSLILLAATVCWYCCNRFTRAATDQGIAATITIALGGVGGSGLAFVAGFGFSPDLSNAALANTFKVGSMSISLLWFLIIVRLFIMPIVGLSVAVVTHASRGKA